jgi:NADH-quinone oxidoreductase subunit F
MAGESPTSSDLSAFLKENGSRGQEMLLPALLLAQRIYEYVPEDAGREISEALDVPLAEISGVIEFYSMLSDHPTAETVIRVCTTPSCASQGAGELVEELKQHLGVEIGESTVDGRYIIEEVECLGLCDHAPGALVGHQMVGQAQIDTIFEPCEHPMSMIYGDQRILTARSGKIDPLSVKEYQTHAGFSGLENALEMTPEEVIQVVKDSGLTGRGGAGFPTGVKWEGCAAEERFPKYLVCNEDESEPGTFKDRALIEGDPFTIIEGMIIAAYAVGAEKGYLYIRGEYTKSHEVIRKALQTAEEHGFLGEKIRGSDFSFEIELRSGAGAYICGEETALFESIEGKRGFPRIKPPYPTTHGLFNQPTVINNVETLANVSYILQKGAEAYREFGTEKSPGPRLFSVSGNVKRPGIYEITKPTTLQELIYEQAGGVEADRNLRAVLLGGAAGKFVAPDQLDFELTNEGTREVGQSLGSGAVVVFDDHVNMKFVLHGLGHFFAHESCGKCYPCQLGTQRQAEILDRVLREQSLPDDGARLADVGMTMTEASICGLGQTASSAVLSAVDLWPDLFAVKEDSYE